MLFFLAQKFIVNEAYWKKPHGPVFLYISGEGPLSKFSVLAGTLSSYCLIYRFIIYTAGLYVCIQFVYVNRSVDLQDFTFYICLLFSHK